MFALGLNILAVVCLVLGFGRYTVGVLLLSGVGLARGGAQLVHGLLPPMLLEKSAPPTDAEVAAASNAGFYCVEGLKNFSTSLSAEYALALDSLAFTCTYGNKNCLTNDMYRGGPPSLGKICGLVWGKVREGVFRC